MALLEVRGLTKRFLGITAVDAVDVSIEAGELVSLIGPNGSGKTTLFNCVTGYMAPDTGRVLFHGRDVTGVAAHRIARLGVGRTFQLVSVFPRLSALENLLTFLQQHQEESVLARLVRAPRVRRYEAAAVERARMLLDSVGLGARRCSTSRTCTPATGRSRCCVPSPPTSGPTRSWRSSGLTGPGSRRCSAPCSAWSSRRAGASGSGARRSGERTRSRCSAAAAPTCLRAAATSRR